MKKVMIWMDEKRMPEEGEWELEFRVLYCVTENPNPSFCVLSEWKKNYQEKSF